jgi:hypothetical protein
MARSISHCLYGGDWSRVSQEEHVTTVQILTFLFSLHYPYATLHLISPDKNPGVKGAQERFARLGVVASILRSQEGRERSVHRIDSPPRADMQLMKI